MRSLAATLACLFLLGAFALSGCGSDSTAPDIKTFFPADNEVGTWASAADTKDTVSKGVNVATTFEQVEAMIDGHGTPFEGPSAPNQVNFAALAVEVFHDSNGNRLEQKVWQMKTAALAKSTFDGLPTGVQGDYQQSTWNWETLNQGTAGRIGTNGRTWKLNAYKGVYIVEIERDYTTAPNPTARADAEAFATAVFKKVP